MARAKKAVRRSAAAEVASATSEPIAAVPFAHRGDVGSGLTWLGWILVGLGALAGVSAAGTFYSTAGYGVAALGALLVGGGLYLQARNTKPAVRTWPLTVPGTILLGSGAAALVYPCFITREAVTALHASASWLPLAAVAMALAGIALLLNALQRQGASEAELVVEPPITSKLAELNPKRFFYDTWKALDAEADAARAARAAAGHTGYDWRPLVVFSTGAVCLALMEYFGHGPTLRDILDYFDPPERIADTDTFFAIVRESPFRRLTEFVWWSGWRVLGFFLVPAVVVKLVLRERLADYGLSTAGFLRHAWIYVLFFAIVLVAVVVVSYEDSFKTYYPFYRDASRSWYDFWAWELLYAAQFFSLEFFFRGFWLKAAKQAMGSHAIYAMVVPYCMIHFGKPFPETLAAILAGIVLGTLALRTRSIWSGFLIHVSVALSMDIAALLQTSGLPDRFWPAL